MNFENRPIGNVERNWYKYKDCYEDSCVLMDCFINATMVMGGLTVLTRRPSYIGWLNSEIRPLMGLSIAIN